MLTNLHGGDVGSRLADEAEAEDVEGAQKALSKAKGVGGSSLGIRRIGLWCQARVEWGGRDKTCSGKRTCV